MLCVPPVKQTDRDGNPRIEGTIPESFDIIDDGAAFQDARSLWEYWDQTEEAEPGGACTAVLCSAPCDPTDSR